MKNLLLCAALLLLPACAAPPVPRGLNDQPLQRITSLSPAGIFAASPDRKLIAFGDNGLQLLEVVTRQKRELDSREPLILGWRRDGSQLAAVFAGDEEQSQLALFDGEGQLLEESILPGRPVALTFSRQDDLLIAGFRLRHFSFGGNLSQWLIRINAAVREQAELGDATLKPTTARALKGRLAELLAVSFSPEGDELIVLQVHDPPQFPAYLQLAHRNWQVPGERDLVQLPLRPVEISWGDAADTVVYRPAAGTWHLLPLWPAGGAPFRAKPLIEPPVAGRNLQRFADGSYLLAANGYLYLGGGVTPPAAAGDDKGWTLRKWRFEGLITPGEYLEVRP